MNGNGKVDTFADLYGLFEQRAKTLRLSDNTITLYGQTAKKFCTWADAAGLEPGTLTALNVFAYVGGLMREDGKPYAVNTLRAHARDIQTMLTFAHGYHIIPASITVEAPKAPEIVIEYLSDEDQASLLEYVDEMGATKPRDAAIVHLLLDTGLRSNEFTSLIWEQVSWDEEIQIGTIKDVLGKGNKIRTVHFGAQSWRYLGALKRQYPGEALAGNHSPSEAYKLGLLCPDTPVFMRERPYPDRLGNRGLALILSRIGKHLGLHLHPHKFRHTAIRNMVRHGMPLQAIMQLSGHSSLKMIEHYSRLESNDVQALYSKSMNGH